MGVTVFIGFVVVFGAFFFLVLVIMNASKSRLMISVRRTQTPRTSMNVHHEWISNTVNFVPTEACDVTAQNFIQGLHDLAERQVSMNWLI